MLPLPAILDQSFSFEKQYSNLWLGGFALGLVLVPLHPPSSQGSNGGGGGRTGSASCSSQALSHHPKSYGLPGLGGEAPTQFDTHRTWLCMPGQAALSCPIQPSGK